MSPQPQPSPRNWRTYLLILLVIFVVGIILIFAPLLPAIDTVLQNLGRSDCRWSASAVTWIDENRNAEQDSNELPLANVSFFVDDVSKGTTGMSAGTSNANGNTSLSIFIDGCDKDEMATYPEAPDGYCLTTPARATSADEQPYHFGFAACTEN